MHNELEKLKQSFLAETISVESIGSIEYSICQDNIKLFKRNEQNMPVKVAKFQRQPGDGWRFCTEPSWYEMKMPHFGHLTNAKTDLKGSKTHASSVEEILKRFGIRYGSVKLLDLSEVQ